MTKECGMSQLPLPDLAWNETLRLLQKDRKERLERIATHCLPAVLDRWESSTEDAVQKAVLLAQALIVELNRVAMEEDSSMAERVVAALEFSMKFISLHDTQKISMRKVFKEHILNASTDKIKSDMKKMLHE